jgi:hypothetical protein
VKYVDVKVDGRIASVKSKEERKRTMFLLLTRCIAS